MQKYGKWIFILIGIIIIASIAFFFFSQNSEQNNFSWNAKRLSSETNVENSNSAISSNDQSYTVETEIAKFSTNIIDTDDDRDTNMKITSSKLHGHIVKNGEEFSFNAIAGDPTPEEGYKKAHVFMDGKMVEGYGGRKLPS